MAENRDIFGTVKVAGMPDFKKIGVPCTITGTSGDAATMHLIKIQGEGAVNLQIDQSFSGKVYTTIFGDKVTNVTFTGISWPTGALCPADSSLNLNTFYSKNKASAGGAPKQIYVSFDGNVFKGILVKEDIFPYQVDNGIDAYSYQLTLVGKFI